MREEPTSGSGKSKKTEAITLRAEFLVAISEPLLSAFSLQPLSKSQSACA